MVSFKLFAGTHIGLRENNEDNFMVCPDLTFDEWIVPAFQQTIRLGSRGCILVVADGMGGQNAGEVASAIAVETVHEMFAPECLPTDILAKPDGIKNYLKKVIVEADARVKVRSEADPETEGMGSTIVIAWVLGDKVYVAWLGDSRAYSYLLGKGIGRMSKDHSYVQQLVDAGAISDDEAMTHQNSNIITRSLGDTSQKAKPDVAMYSLSDGEVILLCSDGLCGVCRDEEIGGVIEEHIADLQKCHEKLTTAALAAGGSDNITIALLQVSMDTEGTKQNIGIVAYESSQQLEERGAILKNGHKPYRKYIHWLMWMVLWLSSLLLVFFLCREKEPQSIVESEFPKGKIVTFDIIKESSDEWIFDLKTEGLDFQDLIFDYDTSKFIVDLKRIKLIEGEILENNLPYEVCVKYRKDNSVKKIIIEKKMLKDKLMPEETNKDNPEEKDKVDSILVDLTKSEGNNVMNTSSGGNQEEQKK